MNELPYKVEHLRKYIGILTSKFSNGKFKMELKVEDNPVLKERWTEKNASSIELNFHYNLGPSSVFFHPIFSCPKYSKQEQCDDCDNIIGMDKIFETNLKHLQIGDTFKIMAALLKDDRSTLPGEIKDFKNFQPLIVACEENRIRLPDTPAGINKKYALEQQRLQREREEEERRVEEEEKRKIEADKAKRREKRVRLEQMFAKYPYTIAIGVAIIGTSFTYEGLRFIGKKIYSLIFPN